MLDEDICGIHEGVDGQEIPLPCPYCDQIQTLFRKDGRQARCPLTGVWVPYTAYHAAQARSRASKVSPYVKGANDPERPSETLVQRKAG
jgi:hypothetical protein